MARMHERDEAERRSREEALYAALRGRKFALVQLSARRFVIAQRNGSETNYADRPFGYTFERYTPVTRPMTYTKALAALQRLIWEG